MYCAVLWCIQEHKTSGPTGELQDPDFAVKTLQKHSIWRRLPAGLGFYRKQSFRMQIEKIPAPKDFQGSIIPPFNFGFDWIISKNNFLWVRNRPENDAFCLTLCTNSDENDYDDDDDDDGGGDDDDDDDDGF